ncbi:unnamed protein product, partial [Amoebophrya sp. A25]|eukprot:GSA25T00002280001.1
MTHGQRKDRSQDAGVGSKNALSELGQRPAAVEVALSEENNADRGSCSNFFPVEEMGNAMHQRTLGRLPRELGVADVRGVENESMMEETSSDHRVGATTGTGTSAGGQGGAAGVSLSQPTLLALEPPPLDMDVDMDGGATPDAHAEKAAIMSLRDRDDGDGLFDDDSSAMTALVPIASASSGHSTTTCTPPATGGGGVRNPMERGSHGMNSPSSTSAGTSIATRRAMTRRSYSRDLVVRDNLLRGTPGFAGTASESMQPQRRSPQMFADYGRDDSIARAGDYRDGPKNINMYRDHLGASASRSSRARRGGTASARRRHRMPTTALGDTADASMEQQLASTSLIPTTTTRDKNYGVRGAARGVGDHHGHHLRHQLASSQRAPSYMLDQQTADRSFHSVLLRHPEQGVLVTFNPLSHKIELLRTGTGGSSDLLYDYCPFCGQVVDEELLANLMASDGLFARAAAAAASGGGVGEDDLDFADSVSGDGPLETDVEDEEEEQSYDSDDGGNEIENVDQIEEDESNDIVEDVEDEQDLVFEDVVDDTRFSQDDIEASAVYAEEQALVGYEQNKSTEDVGAEGGATLVDYPAFGRSHALRGDPELTSLATDARTGASSSSTFTALSHFDAGEQ